MSSLLGEEYQVLKREGKIMTEDRNFGEENQNLKKWGWGRISSCRELYTPLPEGAGAVGQNRSVVADRRELDVDV